MFFSRKSIYIFFAWTIILNALVRFSDINECDTFGVCSQKCTNFVGGYHCSCDESKYEAVASQPHSCKAITPSPYLLFSGRTLLHIINLRTDEATSVVKETGSAVAVDYDYHDKRLFWTDSSAQIIYS